ncbi:MAG TPA: SpoIIE family protein phosphatase [Pseudonocardiaceae bacterium]|nr:SpoIIE family protein phosphatase [Pseudonocardiaceae bacterium]
MTAPTDPLGQSDVDSNTQVGRLAAALDRAQRDLRGARAGADGKALIELAKGVLVERLHCGPVQAARQLAALAQRSGRSELEFAADIVNHAAQDRITETTYDTGREAGEEVVEQEPDEQPQAVALRLRSAESGALAAGDSQAVAESLLAHALAPLGAVAVAIWAAGSDSSLTLAGFAGFTVAEAQRWHYVPPGVATTARQALTDRHAVWFDALTSTEPARIGYREVPGGGRVAVPASSGGRILGVLEICWPEVLSPQPTPIQRQVEALAELCAHTLESRPIELPGVDAQRGRPEVAELVDLADSLLDSVLVLRPQLDERGQLTDFRIQHTNSGFVDPAGRPRSAITGALLLEAYPMSAEQNGLFGKVAAVYETGQPFRAEQGALTILLDEVPVTVTVGLSISRHSDGVLLAIRVPDEASRFAGLLQHAQRLGRIGGFEENALTGEISWSSQLYALYGLAPSSQPIPLQQLGSYAHPDDADAIGRFLRTLLHHRRPASTVFRLRQSDDISRHSRVIAEPVLDADNRLLAIRGAYQDVSAQHWTEVALAATRDQLAHSEQEAAEGNRLALRLQRAIMPSAQDAIDKHGLRIAVRYRPAESDHLVGGDWYDAVELPSEQILLSVGDIAGHGIEAATGMVALRNALRGLATTEAGPAQLLTWLNLVAHNLADKVVATALCGLYDPKTRLLRWARAGHLPPVLIRGRHATSLPMISGILLGAVNEASYAEGEVSLEPGDTLLMYTDGLIERKDRALDDSIEDLLATAEYPATTLEARLDHLLTHSNADTDDDTCIVGIQLH